MEILIAGDLVPTKSNMDLFIKGDVAALLGSDLLALWEATDFRIFNLETPLTDTESPIKKIGPNLACPTKAVKGIKELNPSLISLANNHIMDQGVQGLSSTRKLLSDNGIPYIGVGVDLSKASSPYVLSKDGLKIGVYACAEHEFSIAGSKEAGANPFDPFESLDHIQELKDKCDYVIVLYHGGREHFPYPTPYLQKLCRKMAEKGADLVLCQHSHCVGCYEEYGDSTLVYGQGNFIFDYSNHECWQSSLIVKVIIEAGEVKVDFLPIVKHENTVALAEGKKGEGILKDFNQRSWEILQDGFIESKYQEMVDVHIGYFLREISGVGKWLSRIDRHLLGNRLLKRKYNEKRRLWFENIVRCETHRELLLKGLESGVENARD